MLLDCVICEMDHAVGQILHIKLFASCANIAILKPITLLDSINTCHQYIASNVKFSFLVEKRHDILLDNVSSTTAKAVSFLLSNYFFDLFDTLHNLYAYASICVLARLNQPSISLLRLIACLYRLFLIVFLFIRYLLAPSVVLFNKAIILFVANIFDVECHWDVFERIDLL